MITTFTMTNGKEVYEFTSSDKTRIKLENRFSVELALGKLFEDYIRGSTNTKIKTINHYDDDGTLIETIPFHNKE